MAAVAQPRQQPARAATEIQHAGAGRNQVEDRFVIQPVMVEDAGGWQRGEGRGERGRVSCDDTLNCSNPESLAGREAVPLPSPPPLSLPSLQIRQKRPDHLPIHIQLVRQQKGVVSAVGLDVAVADRPPRGDQAVDNLLRLERRKQPVARKAQKQPAATRPAQRLDQSLRRIAQIEQVDGHGQGEVAVGVEPLAEPVALVRQIRAHGELRLELGVYVARPQPLGVELLRHRLARQVGDVSQHPRDGQSHRRTAVVIVVSSLMVGRIAEDGVAADDVEGQGLARQPRRSGQHGHAGHALGQPRRPGHHGVSAQRPADRGPQPPDAQVVDQSPLYLDDVAHRDHGEVGGVLPAGGRIDAVGPRRAAAAAQQIGTNHIVAVGIDGLAGPDHDIPPAGIVVGIVPGDVRIARQGVANQHGVVALRD